jgi:hypothetical protein
MLTTISEVQNSSLKDLSNIQVLHQSPTKPVVPDFRGELLSGHRGDNSFRPNSHQFAKWVALWGSRVGPLKPTPAHSQMSLRDGMNVRLRVGIQIPEARYVDRALPW